MKKTLVLALAVALTASLIPQNLSAAVGFKGGVAWSNLRFHYADMPSFSLENRKEYVVGMFFGLNILFVTIQPEILYIRMGAGSSGSPDIYRLDYIQVPLLVKLNVLPAGPIKPNIFAGPYGAGLLRAREIVTAGGEAVDVNIKDSLRSTDYGIVFGAGIDFNLALVKITVDARYNLGTTNIDKFATGGDTLKNKAILVTAGIGF